MGAVSTQAKYTDSSNAAKSPLTDPTVKHKEAALISAQTQLW